MFYCPNIGGRSICRSDSGPCASCPPPCASSPPPLTTPSPPRCTYRTPKTAEFAGNSSKSRVQIHFAMHIVKHYYIGWWSLIILECLTQHFFVNRSDKGFSQILWFWAIVYYLFLFEHFSRKFENWPKFDQLKKSDSKLTFGFWVSSIKHVCHLGRLRGILCALLYLMHACLVCKPYQRPFGIYVQQTSLLILGQQKSQFLLQETGMMSHFNPMPSNNEA